MLDCRPIFALTLLASLILLTLTILKTPPPPSQPLDQTATVLEPDKPSITTEATSTQITIEPKLFEYIEITESCGPYFNGTCVNVRSGPGEEYPVVSKLRTGMVLRVANITTANGSDWYEIMFDETLKYPERIKGKWYVAAQVAYLFYDDGEHLIEKGPKIETSKRIIIDRSEQMLYAYDGENLFMEEPISTGLEFTPTPRGTFTIFKMTPSRYMQGPLPGVSDQFYDLPGVPWDLYFTHGGAVIHGAYWHDHFGQPWSHGCVNLPPQKAKELYMWATIGVSVTVRD